MQPDRYQRLIARLTDVVNTDQLLDLELAFAPFDEDDARARRALYQIACRRCHLAGGPAPAERDVRFQRPAPRGATTRFEVRGRIGTRMARVAWADGALFGSVYAIARIRGLPAGDASIAAIRAHVMAAFDHVVLDASEAARSVA